MGEKGCGGHLDWGFLKVNEGVDPKLLRVDGGVG